MDYFYRFDDHYDMYFLYLFIFPIQIVHALYFEVTCDCLIALSFLFIVMVWCKDHSKLILSFVNHLLKQFQTLSFGFLRLVSAHQAH